MVIAVSHSRILVLTLLLLLAIAAPASAYGRSVEDLVGSFSIEKAIKIGSSSECFSDTGATDPLTPPQSPGSGPLADDQPPNLAGFAFEPAKILARSPQPINFTAHIIDDQGVWAAAAYFASPSKAQEAEAFFQAQNLSTGTLKDGFYTSRMLLPSANEKGDWNLVNLTLVDREGNRKILQREDLERLGLPTVINVI
jgi:hypothetical protein